MNESYLFYLVLFCVVTLEHFYPNCTNPTANRRWLINFSLFLFAVAFSWFGKVMTVAVINSSEQELTFTVFALQFLLIDCYRYWLHRLFHQFKLLWSIHLVHHSDTELDVSTEFRHHPLEIIASFVVFGLFTLAANLSEVVVAFYGICASILAMWHHSNIRMSGKLDKLVSVLLVTPYFHRVHHNANRQHTDSNYGTVFTFWDKLFNTYINPYHGKFNRLGLDYFNRDQDLMLMNVLRQPFDYLSDKVLSNKN